MGGPTRPCPGCGTPIGADIKFCGQCGYDLREPAPDERAVVGAPVVAAGTPPPAAAQPAAPEPAKPSAPEPAKSSAPEPAQSSAPEPAQPAAARVAKPASGRSDNRTMLGMTAPLPAPSTAASSQAPSEKPKHDARAAAAPAPTKRTMLGMPSVTSVPLPDPEPVSRESHAAAPGRVLPAASNRTMLGMAAPRGSDPPPAAPVHSPRERAEVKYPHDAMYVDSGSYAPPTRGPSVGRVVTVLLLLVLVAAVGGAGAYFLFGRDADDVRATVVQGDSGEQLRVEIAGAEPGTNVRFAGQELSLEGGSATFPLAPQALHLGDNELVVDVVDPNGEAHESNLTLEVRYRVRADLSGLSREPPSIDVVVDALPGSEVMLDGEPLALDADGHGEREYPLPEAQADASAYQKEVRYRVRLPEATPEEGVVRVRVPYAQMQLDRPGTEVLTEHDAIEIAGAVHSGASVTIDGQAVHVREGRYVHRYPLPEPGAYTPRILTRQAGRAPHVLTIRIERVEDMAAVAASFHPDPGITYARIQQNPGIYRGQKIAVEGRVYNVSVEGGRSDVQILVRDCPRGQRCPLWVGYPAAAEVTVDDWVRVLGTVGGEQQFRSETNRVIAVPRVDAQFLLPLER